MKVLYLVHPEQDYGEYYLFNGLCEILGEENVVTYPFKKSYYGLPHDDYILDDGKKGFTAPGDNIVGRKVNNWDFMAICERIEEFDYIILTSARTYAVNALEQLKEVFNKLSKPLIFTEHEDSTHLRTDIIKQYAPEVVFKRELVRGIDYTYKGQNIYSLPFSCAINSFPSFDDTKKEYSVFGIFGNTWPLRRDVVKLVLNMKMKNSYVGMDTGNSTDGHTLLNYKDFLEHIARSKIALSVRGHGRDTCRRWETAAYETLVMICDPGIIIPNDFEDGKHCVWFNKDLSDLEEKICYYLEHDDERIKIAKAGKEHLMKYHTNQARAKYFLDIVKGET